jgi:hypothetical protein
VSLSDLKGATNSWQLHPNQRRLDLADRVMEMLRQQCAYPGGAADATSSLCIALAELIAVNYSLGSRLAMVDRVKALIKDVVRSVP